MPSGILHKWINPYYLELSTITAIKESVWANPVVRYAVLDNFFRIGIFDELIEQHQHLEFSEQLDRFTLDGKKLPYDGEVCFAKKGKHFGSELFFDNDWHRYLCTISCVDFNPPITVEVKQRRHRPDADGFWIHSDSVVPTRDLVAICYFGKDWKVDDGGLLQLWRVDEALHPGTPKFNSPKGRLDFLTHHKRINTHSPGGGFVGGGSRDLVLVDQIVPTYNRLFVCNFQTDPAYHSVTPSCGRERTGFVQWIGNHD